MVNELVDEVWQTTKAATHWIFYPIQFAENPERGDRNHLLGCQQRLIHDMAAPLSFSFSKTLIEAAEARDAVPARRAKG
jgi:hypothetical protein